MFLFLLQVGIEICPKVIGNNESEGLKWDFVGQTIIPKTMLCDTDDSAYRENDSKVPMAKKNKPKTPERTNREKTKQSPRNSDLEKTKIPIPRLMCCFSEMFFLD